MPSRSNNVQPDWWWWCNKCPQAVFFHSNYDFTTNRHVFSDSLQCHEMSVNVPTTFRFCIYDLDWCTSTGPKMLWDGESVSSCFICMLGTSDLCTTSPKQRRCLKRSGSVLFAGWTELAESSSLIHRAQRFQRELAPYFDFFAILKAPPFYFYPSQGSACWPITAISAAISAPFPAIHALKSWLPPHGPNKCVRAPNGAGWKAI